eukprot:TRINITY_DN11545_c0_g1_i1.p1 TRINITY_DN11545_c0_g1~~TRINITY_DN11545_c0_g1_i1.p1  ORF type:complete len:403 (+),score=91.15 TRINITY_DN11545_c0_g1_i1:83-1291(+)
MPALKCLAALGTILAALTPPAAGQDSAPGQQVRWASHPGCPAEHYTTTHWTRLVRAGKYIFELDVSAGRYAPNSSIFYLELLGTQNFMDTVSLAKGHFYAPARWYNTSRMAFTLDRPRYLRLLLRTFAGDCLVITRIEILPDQDYGTVASPASGRDFTVLIAILSAVGAALLACVVVVLVLHLKEVRRRDRQTERRRRRDLAARVNIEMPSNPAAARELLNQLMDSMRQPCDGDRLCSVCLDEGESPAARAEPGGPEQNPPQAEQPDGTSNPHGRWILLPCDHTLHRSCARKWFEATLRRSSVPTCPVCRADATGDGAHQAEPIAEDSSAAAPPQQLSPYTGERTASAESQPRPASPKTPRQGAALPGGDDAPPAQREEDTPPRRASMAELVPGGGSYTQQD